MKTPYILISGPPGSGKTSIGRALAEDLQLPFFSKDELKEVLFDSMGEHSADPSQLSKAAFALLRRVMEEQFKARARCIIEANFLPRLDEKPILALQQEYSAVPYQLFCTASPDVLLDRYSKRIHTPDRHPAHKDASFLEPLKLQLEKGDYAPLKIGGELITLDTSDFSKVSIEDQSLQITKFMSNFSDQKN